MLGYVLVVVHWISYQRPAEFITKTYQKSLVHLEDQRIYTTWQHKAIAKLMGMHYKNLYKKGQQNRVANALSRVPHAPIHDMPGIFVIQP